MPEILHQASDPCLWFNFLIAHQSNKTKFIKNRMIYIFIYTYTYTYIVETSNFISLSC